MNIEGWHYQYVGSRYPANADKLYDYSYLVLVRNAKNNTEDNTQTPKGKTMPQKISNPSPTYPRPEASPSPPELNSKPSEITIAEVHAALDFIMKELKKINERLYSLDIWQLRCDDKRGSFY